MSLHQQNEINALKERVQALEATVFDLCWKLSTQAPASGPKIKSTLSLPKKPNG